MARYLAVVAIGLVLATLAVGAIGSDADATQEGRLKEALRADWPRLSEAELTALAGMYMKHQDLGKQAGGGATGVQAMLEGGITPPMVAATVSAVILTLIAVKILGGGGGGGGGGSGGAALVPTSTTPFEPLPMVEEGAQSISTSLTPLGGGDTEEIIREQLSRNTLFFGEAGVAATRRSFVVVVGLGGVGSHAAHMLLRSGVERLRIIDFDQVTLSSLNRHAVAQLQDVGVSKGAAMAAHFRRIAPHAEVEVRNEMFTAEAAEELLSGNPDWVLDCIDNFETKIDLLRYCAENGLRVIASMGAGARADPTKVEITDVYDTYRDPLAARVRGALRKAGVAPNIIPAVFSSEMPRVTLSDLPASAVEADANVSEFAPFDNFRVRVLPVLGPLPAIFGNIMATFVLSDLAGQPMDVSCPSGQGKTYAKILSKLRESERRIGQDRCLVDEEDVVALVERVWKRTSPINGVKGTKMQLRRWDQDQPASLTNAVLVTQAMVDDDDAEWTRAAVMAADPDRAARIDARLEEYAALENAWI